MIRGLGCDLCDSRRLEKVDRRYATQFLSRVFTEKERAYCDGKKFRFLSYAKRFAAKEAVVKCLVNSEGISWHDIEILNDPKTRAPMVLLHQKAHQTALLKCGNSRGFLIHLTLSDEGPYGMAMAILEDIK